mmetsp:Transcript_15017/g.41574  ORF Transcript_15017/g.41574 Transcript_15017/m.41574 type:complete len:205 (-) Transcript_15017:392-1006(-)
MVCALPPPLHRSLHHWQAGPLQPLGSHAPLRYARACDCPWPWRPRSHGARATTPQPGCAHGRLQCATAWHRPWPPSSPMHQRPTAQWLSRRGHQVPQGTRHFGPRGCDALCQRPCATAAARWQLARVQPPGRAQSRLGCSPLPSTGYPRAWLPTALPPPQRCHNQPPHAAPSARLARPSKGPRGAGGATVRWGQSFAPRPSAKA